MVSSRAVATHLREEDAEGSIWYLAVDGAGQVVERALVQPGRKLKASLEDGAKARAKESAKREKRATRLSALKEKRRQMKALTPKENQELLDLLAGI